MPPITRGSIYRTREGFGIRWPENGTRSHKAGFRTKTDARAWFDEHVKPRLTTGAPSAEIAFAAFANLYVARWGATVAPRTRATLEERLAPALARFGAWPLRDLESAAADIARWRAELPDGARYRHTHALRQTLGAAVRWRYLQRNPALDAGGNPKPRRTELHPFAPEEIDRLAAELGPVDGALAIFAAETGLRTNEWIALERRDLDRAGRAVLVQRRYAGGRLVPYPKTARSRRRVPLTRRALDAIERLPARLDSPLLFAAPGGGYIGIDNWRSRVWYPGLDAGGIARRGPYALRHTFATEALAAGISLWELARLMGASAAMIDDTYGHLARDSEARLRARLDARSDRSGVVMASGGGADRAPSGPDLA
jgi:integrase